MSANSLGEVSNNETLTIEVTVFDEDTGTVRDLSTAETITFVLHDHHNHSNVVTVTNADGIDTSDAGDGLLVVVVSQAQMSALCAREYAWELHIVFDDGTARNAGQGTIMVSEGLV